MSYHYDVWLQLTDKAYKKMKDWLENNISDKNCPGMPTKEYAKTVNEEIYHLLFWEFYNNHPFAMVDVLDDLMKQLLDYTYDPEKEYYCECYDEENDCKDYGWAECIFFLHTRPDDSWDQIGK